MKRLLPFLEIFAFYALLALANWKFTPESPAFFDMEPHPYWLGILLFGFRYGVLSGLAAGTTAAALYLGISWFFVEKYLFFDASFYALPSWFIVGGTVIGLGVQKYQQRIRTLTTEKNIVIHNELPLRDEIKTLREINSGLEKKIVSQMASIITLYEGARKLETIHIDELYQSILDFIAKTMEAEEASIYVKCPEGWVLKIHRGWKEYQKHPTSLKHHEGIIGLAGSGNKVVTVRDFIERQSDSANQPELIGDSLAAGPLRLGEQGEVVAVFAIQKMSFLKFNSSSISLFSFLLNWASRSLEHAHYIKNLQSKDILDSRYDVYSTRYFMTRAAQELARSRIYYLPLTVGLVKLTGTHSLPDKAKNRIPYAVAQLLKQGTRDIDVIASFEEAEIKFSILFMTASLAQAQEMCQKITGIFTGLDLSDVHSPTRPSLSIGLASFSPQTKSLENLLEEAKKNL